jgi:hypothetical protein
MTETSLDLAPPCCEGGDDRADPGRHRRPVLDRRGACLLALTLLGWAALLIVERRRPHAPRFAVPLGIYALATLVSSVFSTDPTTSVIDSRQLVLFLLVPITYDLIIGEWADHAATAIMSAGR